MTDYGSVIAFARRARTALSRVDVVVLNAGLELTTADDFELVGTGAEKRLEKSLVINVVATFLLGRMVLPKLQETSVANGHAAYLVFVGSMIHIFGKTQMLEKCPEGNLFERLSEEANADMPNRYPLTKLLVTLGVRDLAAKQPLTEKAKGSVVINDVNPGWCKTELSRNKDMILPERFMSWLIGRTGEIGARTLVLASASGLETHGKYLSEGVVKAESDFVLSKEGRKVQEKFARELEGILNRIEDAAVC